jgi:hypothetical protein
MDEIYWIPAFGGMTKNGNEGLSFIARDKPQA